ncbi:MAG TPA: hypothetical protein VNQ73_07875 [Ilumatobacter sp.]|nr:hypothetical protein [Ilumatobacter sp.]
MTTDHEISQVVAALAELRGLRSLDPAASRANETVRLTAHTLEFFWLRALGSPADHL